MLQAYGDGTVFGQRFGEGPVRVVWLHGWGRSSADFAAAGERLARLGVASVAFDLPGFGASPLPPSPVGARGYAALLAPLISAVSDEAPLVVGHSFGGRVALVLASHHPERVAGLLLTGVPLLRVTHRTRSPWRFRLLRALRRRGVVSEQRLERARQRYGSEDYRAATGDLRAILVATVAETYEDELLRWRGPTSLLWGADDHAAPVAVAQRAATLLDGVATLRVLRDVGHLVPSQAPDELAVAVSEMLG